MATLNGLTLNGLSTITTDKNGNITPLPMPTGDSDETEVFDMLGVTKIITLSGTFAGTITDIKTEIDSFEALVDGTQDSTINFVFSGMDTIAVKVMSVNTTWNIPGFTCSYTIQIVQGV